MAHSKEIETYRERLRQGWWRKPATRFVIFSRARSGSTLLVDLMNSSPDLFCDGELFVERPLFPREFIRSRAAVRRESVFGFKLLSYQMFQVLPERYRFSFLPWLSQNQGYRIIYLRRRDTLAQEVSNVLAHQRKLFQHRSGRGDEAPKTQELDITRLMGWLGGNLRYAEYENQVLENLDHLSLIYEDDLLDGQRHQQTLNQALDYLELDPCEARTSLEKISVRPLRESLSNYEELLDAVAVSEYAYLLESHT
ncbi:MAG: hypothetical protein AAF640_09420 [Pseudomonadota bacterium]